MANVYLRSPSAIAFHLSSVARKSRTNDDPPLPAAALCDFMLVARTFAKLPSDVAQLGAGSSPEARQAELTAEWRTEGTVDVSSRIIIPGPAAVAAMESHAGKVGADRARGAQNRELAPPVEGAGVEGGMRAIGRDPQVAGLRRACGGLRRRGLRFQRPYRQRLRLLIGDPPLHPLQRLVQVAFADGGLDV